MEKLIEVSEIYPPIPTNRFDYCATLIGYEEGDPYGWGSTAEEAVDDLLMNCANNGLFFQRK